MRTSLLIVPLFFLSLPGTFFAYSNRIEGTLPTEIGTGNLVELQLFNNRFTGSIPDELFANEGLILLRLDINNFQGPMSPSIGNLLQLKDLWLSNNTLTGTLPPTIARLSNLGTIDLLSIRHFSWFKTN
jgi:hypothetical protein